MNGLDKYQIASAHALAGRIVQAADTEDTNAKRDCVLDYHAMADAQREATLAELANLYQGSNLNVWS